MSEFSNFVESLKRLYEDKEKKLVNEAKIAELFANGKITNQEKWYILKQD